MINRINRNPSAGVSFILSLLPGVGHMYLGLMRRGTEFLLAFFGSIFIISDLMSMAEIGIPIAITMFFYNIFDVQQLRRAILQDPNVQDEGFLKIGRHPLNDYHIGIGIMAIGILFLFNRLSLHTIIPQPVYGILRRSLGSMLLIAAGIYFIIKSKKYENA